MDKVLDYGKSAHRGAPKKKAQVATESIAVLNERPAQKPASRPPPPQQPAPQTRKLSEAAEATIAKDLDLFGITRPRHACACPDCRRELTTVGCLGRKLKACLHCRGVWFPLGVIKTFDKDGAWLNHLGPAIQAAVHSTTSQSSQKK